MYLLWAQTVSTKLLPIKPSPNEPMAGATVHLLLFACAWKAGYYVACQSTANQFTMEVYIKKSRNINQAMGKSGKWRKLAYQIPWTLVMYYLFYDPKGVEIILMQNNYQDKDGVEEKGLTCAYRFFSNFRLWHYAQVDVPETDKWSSMYLN